MEISGWGEVRAPHSARNCKLYDPYTFYAPPLKGIHSMHSHKKGISPMATITGYTRKALWGVPIGQMGLTQARYYYDIIMIQIAFTKIFFRWIFQVQIWMNAKVFNVTQKSKKMSSGFKLIIWVWAWLRNMSPVYQ